jgi:hypothetical protein
MKKNAIEEAKHESHSEEEGRYLMEKLCFVDGRNQLKQLLYLSNLKKEKLPKNAEYMKTNFNISLSRTYRSIDQDLKNNQIIILTQVKCDYVTISGQFGVEKLIQDYEENLYSRNFKTTRQKNQELYYSRSTKTK